MKPLRAIALMTCCATAQASPVEVWECKDVFGGWETILVIATVEPGRIRGSIAVAGVTHSTEFEVAGFDRRWDFGLKGNGYQYAFVIEPNGDAKYFDFRTESRVKPSKLMKCRQKSG